MSALERVTDALDHHGLTWTAQPAGISAQCPAHDDRDPSLSIDEGDDGRVLLHCHAGCSPETVLDALGLTFADLYDDAQDAATTTPPAGPAEYVYTDAAGTAIGKVVRRRGKRFHQEHPVGQHWESGGCSALSTTPYRLPEVLAAVRAGHPVLIVEGERDVETARALGLVATCNAGGVGGQWREDHAVHLTGAEVTIVRDNDPPGHQHAVKAAASLEGRARSVRVVDVAAGKDFTDHVHAGYGVHDLVDLDDPGDALVSVTLSDVEPEELRWQWKGRLPVGKLVTIDGDPGTGKSTLTVALAAHVTTGRDWPDGAPCPTGDVVVLSAEDGLADTIRPRLDAAGGDPSRVHALTGLRTAEGHERPLTLGDIVEIAQFIRRHRARLLIVDVLMAYLPGKVDSHRDQDIRSVLHRVAAMAEETGCTVILLRHLNKSAGGSPMYRGGGSIGIIGAARAAYVVALDPDDAEVRIFACVKNNLARMPGSLKYRLETVSGSDPEMGVARVEWTGTSAHTADDLLRSGDDGGDDRREIDRWLEDLLRARGCAMAANEVFKSARRDNYSTDQVKRAKKRLRIDASKSSMDGGWTWTLPEGSTKGAKSAASESPPPSPPSVLPSQPTPTGCDLCGALQAVWFESEGVRRCLAHNPMTFEEKTA